jgi:hypothetical protein
MILTIIFGLFCCVSANGSNEIPTENKSNTKLKCESSYSLMCLKLDILSLVDKISTSNTELKLTQGITLVRENNPNKTQNSKIVSELARAFPDSPEKRLNGFLVAKIQDVLNSYSLKFKLINQDTVNAFQARKDGGEKQLMKYLWSENKIWFFLICELGFGGGGKDKGGKGAMMAMAMMMKGAMMAMGLGAVAALAGKALLTGMMALTLAGIAALKSLTSKDDKKTTYEIISKPVYSHSHSHSHGTSHAAHPGGSQEDHGGYGGYGRSLGGDVTFQLPKSVKP